MLGFYWSISFNILNILNHFALSPKKFIFKKPVVLELNETRSGRIG